MNSLKLDKEYFTRNTLLYAGRCILKINAPAYQTKFDKFINKITFGKYSIPFTYKVEYTKRSKSKK